MYLVLGIAPYPVYISAGVVGGYCEQPGECLCSEGYSGEDCSVCDASVGTCGECLPYLWRCAWDNMTYYNVISQAARYIHSALPSIYMHGLTMFFMHSFTKALTMLHARFNNKL